ncbi:MAG: heme exporter protein CcmD [Pararhizobium sp.]
MTHGEFVFLSYAITGLAILALVVWILLDQRARRTELAELEAMGVRRRSAGKADDREGNRP